MEIWLKEVEGTMLDSVKEQMKFALDDYFAIERMHWLISWPGQVVLGISCLAWTYEVNTNQNLIIHKVVNVLLANSFQSEALSKQVEEAIEANTLPQYLDKCTSQIVDLVKLVRTDLTSNTRITIEALIVLDVHGKLLKILQNIFLIQHLAIYRSRCGGIFGG